MEVSTQMGAIDATAANGLLAALQQIPCGLFILSAASEGHRSGVLTRWAQPCSIDPPMLMTAIPTGLSIEPIIRNSRAFALGQISDCDRLLRRRFAAPAERGEDPFITIPHWTTPTGSPVPERVHAYFECELIRHVDLDADHRLLVGKLIRAGIQRADEQPAVELGGALLHAFHGADAADNRSDASDSSAENTSAA